MAPLRVSLARCLDCDDWAHRVEVHGVREATLALRPATATGAAAAEFVELVADEFAQHFYDDPLAAVAAGVPLERIDPPGLDRPLVVTELLDRLGLAIDRGR